MKRQSISRSFAFECLLQPQPDGGFVVVFPDLPEAISQGDDKAAALENAIDCLEEALAARIKAREAIPRPAPRRRRSGHLVLPGSLIQAKAMLWSVMLEEGIVPAALAKLLGRPRQDVTRLLDPRHRTHYETLDAAFSVLRRRLGLQLLKAA